MTKLLFNIFLLSVIDNDKPTLTTTTGSPLEGGSVTLTCTAATSDEIDSHTWYKNNIQIAGATTNSYRLPNETRVDDGNYTCTVTTKSVGESFKSDNITIRYLCKLSLLYFIYLFIFF